MQAIFGGDLCDKLLLIDMVSDMTFQSTRPRHHCTHKVAIALLSFGSV